MNNLGRNQLPGRIMEREQVRNVNEHIVSGKRLLVIASVSIDILQKTGVKVGYKQLVNL